MPSLRVAAMTPSKSARSDSSPPKQVPGNALRVDPDVSEETGGGRALPSHVESERLNSAETRADPPRKGTDPNGSSSERCEPGPFFNGRGWCQKHHETLFSCSQRKDAENAKLRSKLAEFESLAREAETFKDHECGPRNWSTHYVALRIRQILARTKEKGP